MADIQEISNLQKIEVPFERGVPYVTSFVYPLNDDPLCIHGGWGNVLDIIYKINAPCLAKTTFYRSTGKDIDFNIYVPGVNSRFRIEKLNSYTAFHKNDRFSHFRFLRTKDIVRIQKRAMFAIIHGSVFGGREQPQKVIALYRKIPNAFPSALADYLQTL